MSTPEVLQMRVGVEQQGIDKFTHKYAKKMRIITKLTWTSIIEGDLERLQQISECLEEMGGAFQEIKINKYGWNPLHAACYFGQRDIVNYLIYDKNLNPSAVNENGWDGLIFAVMGGVGTQVVDLLLCNNKIDINHTDNFGKTALSYAQTI